MNIGMTSSAPTPLRRLIENRLSELTAETESLFSEARETARREVADQLNQAVRRLRQSANLEELSANLTSAASAFAPGATLFRVNGDRAQSDSADIPLASAPALRGAIDTRDPVIAAATPGELSESLLALLGQPADGRVCIFPLVVRDAVPALLCVPGSVAGSSIELLSQVGAGAWDALTPPPAPAPVPELVSIAPAPQAPASPWDQMPPDEQQVHLRAQRFARVQVADMRLFSGDAVHSGRERRDLYGSLGPRIDAAREAFRSRFFAACPSMVDYLHLEILRTLANDDPELLGKNYPGPLV
jgi:hypothetical protein